MNVFAFVFPRLTYAVSLAIALNQYTGSKKKALYYFLLISSVSLLLNEYLMNFSVLITSIIVALFMIITEKKKLYDALFITTNAITWIIICILICTICPLIFAPSAVGTNMYNIVIGFLQVALTSLISPYTKRFTDIPHSKRIKLLSIVMQSTFIVVYGGIVPLISGKPFFIIYAVFGIFAILLMVYIHYTVGYMVTTDIEQKIREKELNTTKTLYTNISDVFKKAMIDSHYSTGLAKTIASYLDKEDLSGLKDYFYTKVEPCMNMEIKKIDALNNIHDELIRNLIYLTQKRADGEIIPMSVEIEGIITDFFMDSFDLFKILNIYFDNAIDASKLCENPFIKLKVRNNLHSVSMELSNKFEGQNMTAVTPLNRGHGLKIANGYIVKYSNITTNTFINENIFTQKLVIGEV